MAVLHFLRALSNLGLYYTFAGTVAGALGAAWPLALLLVQSGCFALSAAAPLRAMRWARLAALAPAFLMLPVLTLPDRVLALPGLAYLVYLVWREDYALRWGWQADVFSLLWKLFLPFAPVSALFGCQVSVVTQGIPLFLTGAAASVLLLRSIRHGPEIYLQRAYQLRNWLAVAVLLACAYGGSTDWFLRGVDFVYSRVILPVLLGAAMAVGMVCLVVVPMVLYLLLLGLSRLLQREWNLPQFVDGEQIMGQVRETVGVGEDFSGQVLTALGILAAALAVIWLFRWLARRKPVLREDGALPGERQSVPEERRRPRQMLPATYAGRIRGQYRQFLKLCQRRGVELVPSDTSAQVSAKAARWMPDPAALAELEEIYCRARYSGQATAEDLAQVKRLCGALRRAARQGVPC